jgi:hypothetical protein
MPVKTRAFIRETAAAIDCPVELVAVPVVATLSAALGHAREVEVKRGHEQSAAIYALGIADSGSGKSPAASKAQKPLKTIQSENNKKYKESLEIYEQQMRVHAASAKRARKNVEPEPEPPSKPVFKRTWVENITIEALAPRLEQNPYGLGLFHDELTGWIRGFDQYKSGGKGDTRQQYLKIWSNDSIAIDRKGDDETIILERPYLTVYGTIQPRLIEDMGVDREDGFINRFLMAYPGPHIARENDEEISYQSEISYEELVKELYKLRPRGVGEKSTLIVKFNRSARELYKEHSNRLASNAGNPATPRGLRDTYPKLRAYLARLSLLMATCREIESGGDTEITRRDVEAAATLMEYFEGVAKKVHHEIASSDTETRIAFELFSLLNRSGGHKTATADEFRRALPLAPDTPEATSKLLRKIVKKHPELILEDGWRGKERVMKISLVEKTVGTVGTDGGGPDEDDGDDEAGYV